MLSELKVSNFALIDNAHIQFQPGLNILSGETGAGKSILLKSLALLMGEKASSDAVRAGCDMAVVEGLFDLSARPDLLDRLKDLDCLDDDRLVIRRVVSSQGKNKIYINSAMSTLQTLQDLVFPIIQVTGDVAPLIEMTGQHDNRSLLSKDYHLDCVDLFAGHSAERDRLKGIFQDWKAKSQELERLANSERERAQRLDYLRFQRDEIRDAESVLSQNLELEYKVQKGSAKLQEFAHAGSALLSDEETSFLSEMQKLILRGRDLVESDPKLNQLLEPLEDLRVRALDLNFDFLKYAEKVQSDPVRLAQIEDQMAKLRSLQRKYGVDPTAILQTLRSIEVEVEQLERSEGRIGELQNELNAVSAAYVKLAEKLHVARKAKAVELAKVVNGHLKELNMKDTLFSVGVAQLEGWSETGVTDLEFRIQSSVQDSARPIQKIASGGELSRILLSLKVAVGQRELPRTYLFDEVDAGVSGLTAEKVGRKLRQIASGQQVICVTHLPQVAAFGSAHFLIQKVNKKEGVQTEVLPLGRTERVRELARLVSGEKITKTSLAHAESLLEL